MPSRVRPGTRALFLHGSNYGTCREFAASLADEAMAIGCETEVAPLDAYAAGLPTDRLVVITAASYNGQPTDDATAFAARLDGTERTDDLTYAVLGVGDRNWAATYQHFPTRIDERLAELGGTRFLERTAATPRATSAARSAPSRHDCAPPSWSGTATPTPRTAPRSRRPRTGSAR